MMKTMSTDEKLLTISEKVIKIRNSSSKWIKIPDSEFKEIKHDDVAEKLYRKEDQDFIYVIYAFNKKQLKE